VLHNFDLLHQVGDFEMEPGELVQVGGVGCGRVVDELANVSRSEQQAGEFFHGARAARNWMSILSDRKTGHSGGTLNLHLVGCAVASKVTLTQNTLYVYVKSGGAAA
jgi:hypothetical protein